MASIYKKNTKNKIKELKNPKNLSRLLCHNLVATTSSLLSRNISIITILTHLRRLLR
jgi:hypothetical protein